MAATECFQKVKMATTIAFEEILQLEENRLKGTPVGPSYRTPLPLSPLRSRSFSLL